MAESEYCKDEVLRNPSKSADAVLDFARTSEGLGDFGGEGDGRVEEGRGRKRKIYQIFSQATMGRITGQVSNHMTLLIRFDVVDHNNNNSSTCSPPSPASSTLPLLPLSLLPPPPTFSPLLPTPLPTQLPHYHLETN